MTAPKIELHVHLEGTVRPATLLEIARRNWQPLPAETVAELAEALRLHRLLALHRGLDPHHQLPAHRATTSAGWWWTTPPRRPASARSTWRASSPRPSGSQRGVDWAEIFTGYAEGAVEAHERYGVMVRFTPDLYRGVDPEVAEEAARQAVRYADRGVVGFGIGGSETASPAAPYAAALRRSPATAAGAGAARRRGGRAGVGPGDSGATIRRASATGCGRWRTRRCWPRSSTGGWSWTSASPPTCAPGWWPARRASRCRALRAAGVPCTINTDDPAMFGTDLAGSMSSPPRSG